MCVHYTVNNCNVYKIKIKMHNIVCLYTKPNVNSIYIRLRYKSLKMLHLKIMFFLTNYIFKCLYYSV